MSTQFYMRAYNVATSQYVDWVVNDQPDNTGFYSGVNPGDLTNITINRTVTSKVNNFLKPSFPDFLNINTTYGPYLFHLNSYDWLHPTATALDPAIPAPTNLIGIAVNRGTTDNNFPAPTPRDFATIFWDESVGTWNFGLLDPTGSVTIYTETRTGNLTVDGYMATIGGGSVAQSGQIRLANSNSINSRNGTDNGDLSLIFADVSNRINLGNSSIPVVVPSYQVIDNYLAESTAPGGVLSNTAGVGFIRLKNSTDGIAFKANTPSTNDASIIKTDALDQLYIGDQYNNKIIYNTSTFGTHSFLVNTMGVAEINGLGLYFNIDLFNPKITQTIRGVGSGQNLCITAQSSTDLSGRGGSIVIDTGTGAAGDGYADIRTSGLTKIRVFGSTTPTPNDYTQNSALDPNSIVIFNPTIRFYNSLTSGADIKFDPIDVAFNPGAALRITGQDNTGISATGGNVELFGGNAPGLAGTGGNVVLSVGTGTAARGSVVVNSGVNNLVTISESYQIFDTLAGGNYQFKIATNAIVEISDDKLITNSGRRRNVTIVDSNYLIVNSDDFLFIDLLTNTLPITVTLPAIPSTGDTYDIKDAQGVSNTYAITIQGNGNNIEGVGSIILNTAYASVSLIYNGAEWNKI